MNNALGRCAGLVFGNDMEARMFVPMRSPPRALRARTPPDTGAKHGRKEARARLSP
jgi:hypothetical protein